MKYKYCGAILLQIAIVLVLVVLVESAKQTGTGVDSSQGILHCIEQY